MIERFFIVQEEMDRIEEAEWPREREPTCDNKNNAEPFFFQS